MTESVKDQSGDDVETPTNDQNENNSASTASSSRVGQRDLPISTIIRMMGLPTKSELVVLEQKLDALTTKVNNLGSKLERIVSNFEHGSEFDRIDVQLTDIRATLREVLPKALAQLSASGSRAAVKKDSGEEK